MWYYWAIALILVVVLFEPVRRALKKRKAANDAPVPAVVKSPVGKWTGQLVPATSGTWGGANDEHDPKYTNQVLAGRPDWHGLGYCPGGSFAFEVHADGGITGGAMIYLHDEPVHGRPVLANGAYEIEFNLASHKIKLNFNGDTVTGLLWEGHDLLKRANVAGARVV